MELNQILRHRNKFIRVLNSDLVLLFGDPAEKGPIKRTDPVIKPPGMPNVIVGIAESR